MTANKALQRTRKDRAAELKRYGRNMSNTAQTARNVVTPRRIAWVLLLGGAAWFVIISPRTPLQFFDAGSRDSVALGRPPSEHARLLETLMSICRETDRIELSYDMTNDPAKVQHNRSSILSGFYHASPQTREALMRNNSTYHSLVEQVERLRLDLMATCKSKADAPNRKRETEEDMDLQMKRFNATIDRMLLRQFQSKLFWWGRQ